MDTARDGVEGIEMIAANEYAVIVLDLMMPRINGAGVMKYLSEYHPDRLPTLVVMTAFGASAMASLTPPPAHFLEKPFDVDELVREVAECVKSSAASPEP